VRLDAPSGGDRNKRARLSFRFQALEAKMGQFSEDAVRRSEQESQQRELRGDGRGATRGGQPKSSGAGDFGGGRGTDHSAPPVREPESETAARQGPIADEHMPEGWGGEGENYAPAQGPNERGEGEQSQDRKFREGRPPAGVG
jgi:hypothetical protein